MSFYGEGIFYGEGAFYSPSGIDVPIGVDFHRTDIDGIYTFRWTFQQAYFNPLLSTYDYQLQIDTVSTFDSLNLATYETTSVTDTIPVISPYVITLTSPVRVLVVESATTTFTEDTTGTPLVGQYFVDLTGGTLTFNVTDAGTSLKIIYVSSPSEDILEYQRGNVVKGFSVPVYPRLESQQLTFYARVRVKSLLTFSDWSNTLIVTTIENIQREAADRLITSLPDRHVYPRDEILLPLASRTKVISKVFETWANEFDLEYLEKELTKVDALVNKSRDEVLYSSYGNKFGFPKPGFMQFTDYRYILAGVWFGSLIGGTYGAVKNIGRAFTGVDPEIIPFVDLIDFVTAGEETTTEKFIIPLVPSFTHTLSKIPRIDPSVRGCSISGLNAGEIVTAGLTLTINLNGDGAQSISLAANITGLTVAADIQAKVRALTAFTPSNQSAYDNFLAEFNTILIQYSLASGTDGPSSTVVVSGGTAAATLKLGIANGGFEETGLTYVTGSPISGEYTVNFNTGLLTFAAADFGRGPFFILYQAIDTIYTYTPGQRVQVGSVPLVPSYTIPLTYAPSGGLAPTIPGFAWVSDYIVTSRGEIGPRVGEFTINFGTGVVTFNSADAGAPATITYYTLPPTIYSRTESGFSILIRLHNPAQFTLDLTIIEFLIKQIIPAHTRFVLEVVT